MKKIILINKKEGETPLEALEFFRKKNKQYQDLKMTYAGRLDPMASGLLLLLAGEETKQKEKYLNLDKEYTFEILFGFSTDTYDILGKVLQKYNSIIKKEELKEQIKKELKNFLGKQKQAYPLYSSKTVKGKPLFFYARNNEKVEIPSREIFIKRLELGKIRKIDNQKLLKNISKRVSRVKGPASTRVGLSTRGGDFRQKEILKIWRKNLKKNQFFYLVSFSIQCSSGTYVRSVANLLGQKTKIPALAFSISRRRIGKFML